MPPKPGEVYRILSSGPKPRRGIIVSREGLNGGNWVVVVPLTSQHLDRRRGLPNCVAFQAGDPGIEEDCVAQAEGITVTHRTDLLEGPFGPIPEERLQEVVRAVGNVMDAECVAI